MLITQQANKLVRKFKTNCPFELASYLNIEVWFLDLPEGCRGYYLKTLRRRYIAISTALTYIEQRFVCAHELGHDRLHPGMGYYFIEENTLYHPGKLERQANTFAVRLLTMNNPIMEFESKEEYCSRIGIPREMGRYI